MNQSKSFACVALLLMLSAVSFGSNGKKKDFSVRGYVLDMESLEKFDLDDYSVRCTEKTRVVIPQPDESRLVGRCRPEAIKVGAELEVTGEYDPATEQIEASEIVVQIAGDGKTNGTALIERQPSLQKTDTGWSGTILADGRRLQISPATQVRFTYPDKKEALTTSSETVGVNDWIAYSGTRESDGAIHVERLAVSHNSVSKKEQKFRTKYDAAVVAPDYTAKKAGHVVIKSFKPFEIIPNQAVQDEIARIGDSLVPDFQRSLAESDRAKIHFHFYVVSGMKHGVLHTPDGSVFVSAAVLDRLANTAQLAGVLAAEIAAVVQEQDYRLNSNAEWGKALCWGSIGGGFLPMGLGLPVSAINIANSYAYRRQMNNLNQQAGRLAVEYVAEAGYDPREVRSAFKRLSKNSDEGMNLKGQERSYYVAAGAEAANELGLAYSGADFSKYKVDAESYQAFLANVKSAAGAKQR